jgi:superfamily I DNA and/or RNA helicase
MAADQDCRVFLSCKTHAATDVLLANVVQAQARLRELRARRRDLFDQYFDARLLEVTLFRVAPKGPPADGVVALPRKEEKPKGTPNSVDRITAARWCVVASTPGGVYAMVKERWSKGLLGHELCDCLVLDEASQMNLPEAMLAALLLRPAGQLVVVGDPRQMPPIIKHDWTGEPRRTFKEYRTFESLFDTLLALKGPIIKFEESFRLHADMAEFLRREIYQQDGIPYFSRRRQTLLAPAADLDPFVASVLSPEHTIVVVVHEEASSQLRNPYEQALISPILTALADPAAYNLTPEHGLGVVVPHRAQRAALQEAIPALTRIDPQTGATLLSAVDTVERFQGDEREVILVSATESDREYLLLAGKFLLDPRRLTVALSRAKHKMVLVASASVFSLFSTDEETFAHVQLWKNLLRYTCMVKLWEGEREGQRVTVWGSERSSKYNIVPEAPNMEYVHAQEVQ